MVGLVPGFNGAVDDTTGAPAAAGIDGAGSTPGTVTEAVVHGSPPTPADVGGAVGSAPAWSLATPAERAVAVAAGLLATAVLFGLTTGSLPPHLAVMVVVAAAGIPVLLARAAGAGIDGTGTWAARAALGFVAVGAVSSALAASPALALVGSFIQGTGWVFMVALASAWALGTTLGRAGRLLLEQALVAGALANAVVALAQSAVGGGFLDVVASRSEVTGLLGNPVFLATLLAASLALLGDRFLAAPRRWWLAVVLVTVALGVASERLALVMAVAVVAIDVVRAGRHHRSTPARWRAAAYGVLCLAGVAAGVVLAQVRGHRLSSQVLHATAQETFGDRLQAWRAGLLAVVHHPLVGTGPDQYQAATSALFPLSFVQRHPGWSFIDAHNLFVEYAVTTGVLGAALLVAWLVAAGRGALRGARRPGQPERRRLVLFAGVVGAVALAEPLNVVVLPLAMLALGAAGAGGGRSAVARGEPGRRGRLLAWTTWGAAACGLVVAGLYLVGDNALDRATAAYEVADDATALSVGALANTLLAPWAEPAQLLGQVHYYLGLPGDEHQGLLAAAWYTTAAHRDPGDPDRWAVLASTDIRFHRYAAARAAAAEALARAPYFAPAMVELGIVAGAEGQKAAEQAWFERAVQADPSQPALRRYLTGSCAATGVLAPLPGIGCPGTG